MTESIKIVDIVVEYTDKEGKSSKLVIVLNEIISKNLGEILRIDDYIDKVKRIFK